jgi:hypothetical protein
MQRDIAGKLNQPSRCIHEEALKITWGIGVSLCYPKFEKSRWKLLD